MASTGQAVWIAAAGKVLVVVPDGPGRLARSDRSGEQIRTPASTCSCILMAPLLVAGLEQDRFWNGDLADVVEQAALVDRVELWWRQAEHFANSQAVLPQAAAVALGVGVFRLDGMGQAHHHCLGRLQALYQQGVAHGGGDLPADQLCDGQIGRSEGGAAGA